MQAGKIDLSEKVALAGADVVIDYSTSQQQANRIRDKIAAVGQRAAAIGADVGDTAQCRDLVRQAEATFGRMDILVRRQEAANTGL